MKHLRTIAPPARLLSRIAAALLLAGAATQAAAVITINTVAGTGANAYSGDGGPATAAALSGPRGVAVDRSGRVYIADSDNNIIRRIKLDGTIETIAGVQNGPACVANYSGDGGPATSAHLGCATSVASDSLGNLYIADMKNHRIRKVDANTGTIATVAGTGTPGYGGDGGPATSAQLQDPFVIVIDSQDRVYISDQGNRRVRRIETDGTITTVAGDGGASETGNGGQATSAGLGGIWGIGLDAQDRLYVTNVGSVRRVEADGTINRVAGNGSGSYSGDGGPALSAGMVATGVMVDASGRMYISDSSQRIRRVGLDGTINTVAGTGVSGFSGDGGDASVATFNGIYGLTVGNKGLLYFPDYSNLRIRALTLDVPTEPLAASASAGNAQATVQWNPPSNNGGNAITGYVVTVVGDPSKRCTATPPATSCVVTGLTNGTPYTFAVRADNDNGAGAEAEAGPVTPSAPPVPSAPLNPAATAGNAQATVSWEEPVSGGPFTEYTVTAVEDPSKTCTVTGTPPLATSCTVPGLTNGSTYTFTVRATNANGTGMASAVSNAVTPAAPPVPSAPLNPAATAGNAQATVSWDAPASGGPFTEYTVTAVEDPSKTCTATPPATSCTVPGLTNGSTYTFTVRATNANGTGAASTVSNAVTPSAPPVPSAPLNPAATAGNGQATVSWSAPASGGPFTLYTVTAVEDPTKTCTATPPATRCVVSGLTNGRTYTFTVTASNASGTGTASAVSNAVTPQAPSSSVAPIPTLSEWALLALSTLLALAMAFTLRRQR
ncbi:MAG: hypothetical protein BGO75_19590 [Burkholderiales bacterium 68-20]|nr:MAG: hypothetical protein BGO75_19590 [Burkholderiales bacterium 68-20]